MYEDFKNSDVLEIPMEFQHIRISDKKIRIWKFQCIKIYDVILVYQNFRNSSVSECWKFWYIGILEISEFQTFMMDWKFRN